MTSQEISELQVREVWPEAWFTGMSVWRCKRAFPQHHLDMAAILDNTLGSLGSDWVDVARHLERDSDAWETLCAKYFANSDGIEDRI